jgi:hypothetical protein
MRAAGAGCIGQAAPHAPGADRVGRRWRDAPRRRPGFPCAERLLIECAGVRPIHEGG